MLGGIARLLSGGLLSRLGQLGGIGGDVVAGLLLRGGLASDLLGELLGVFQSLLTSGEAGVGPFQVVGDVGLALSRLGRGVGLAAVLALTFFAALFSLLRTARL